MCLGRASGCPCFPVKVAMASSHRAPRRTPTNLRHTPDNPDPFARAQTEVSNREEKTTLYSNMFYLMYVLGGQPERASWQTQETGWVAVGCIRPRSSQSHPTSTDHGLPNVLQNHTFDTRVSHRFVLNGCPVTIIMTENVHDMDSYRASITASHVFLQRSRPWLTPHANAHHIPPPIRQWGKVARQ